MTPMPRPGRAVTHADSSPARSDHDDDLACDCPDALPLVGGILLGLAATAGWFLRTAWVIAHRPETIGWLRSAR